MNNALITLIISICISSADFTEAATFYVGKSGSDTNSCNTSQSNTPSNRQLSIRSGLSCLSPGDTLIIGTGSYSEPLTGIPNGSSANGYVTIQAETDDGVILTGGLALTHTNQYITITGLRFQDVGGTKVVLGNHLKFFRNEFKYGCPSGNCTNTQVGSNDFNDTADILFEDNWWHGVGGRYNIMIYNANRIIVRRGIVRHDGGWTDTKGDPEAGLTIYNSSNVALENCIVIDSNLNYHNWQGSIYTVYNSASPNSTINNSYYGNIALNDATGYGFRTDGNGSLANFIVRDLVVWDTLGVTFCSGSCSMSSLDLERATIGHSTRNSSANGIMAFGSGMSGTLKNLIVTGNNSDFNGTTATYFDTYNNSNTASSGTGRLTISPFTSGLQFLPRIEDSSILKSAGSGGGQIGAQIANRIGISGTLHGETGWNTDTGAALWPWPNEARIKKNLCTDAGVTRGFCSSSSLTNYIWQYLGNTSPYNGSSDITPPIAPTNLRVS